MEIILATTSPYRIRAMELAGISFEARGSDIEEYFEGRPNNPIELVKHLSRLKAEYVAKGCADSLVLGFDSVAEYNGEILEKPRGELEAFERLKKLSGDEHDFHTGISLINTKTGKLEEEVVSTHVEFRELSIEEIICYLREDPNYRSYASGYDSLGNRSTSFIRRIDGDPNNILRGIPLAAVVEMIRKHQE